MPDIDRLLQDLLTLEEALPADLPRILPALEHARARLWLAALRSLAGMEPTSSSCAPGPGFLTVKEVAGQLRFSTGHVYELVRRGHLRVVKHGRTIRIPREALAEWQAASQAHRLDDQRWSSGESGADDRTGANDDRSLTRPRHASVRRRSQ